ncbi:MAG: hypothetical protein ABI430_02935 [Candidatus Taylorbacteria bacterium]
MSKNTIKIITSIGILVILGASFYYFSSNSKKQDLQTTTLAPSPDSDFDSSDPYDRQNRINDVIITKGKDYPRFSLTKDGPKNLIITYYLINLKNLHSEDMNLRRHSEGILVFEEKTPGEIKLIWESADEFTDPRVKVGVYDLTADGVNELIALLDNDQGGAMLVYKWNGDGFDLITPYDEHIRPDGKVSPSLAFGADSGMTKIYDVDKDGIPEIVFPFDIRLNWDESTLNFNYRKVYRAYKWDGSKYYLWKEQKQSFTPSTTEDQYSVISILNRLEN